LLFRYGWLSTKVTIAKFFLIFIFFCDFPAWGKKIIIPPDTAGNKKQKDLFLRFKQQATIKEKTNFLYELSQEDLCLLYPLVKDTLYKMKERIFKKSHNTEARLRYNWIESRTALCENNIPLAVYLLENALEMYCQTKKDSEQVVSKLVDLFDATININKIIYYNDLYKNFLSPDKKPLISESRIYGKIGLYSKAIFFKYKEAEKEKITDSFNLAHFHNDLGVYFAGEDQLDSSRMHYTLAMNIAKNLMEKNPDNIQFKFMYNLTRGNLAHLMFLEKKYQEAIPYFTSDFLYSKKAGEWLSAFNAGIELAACYAYTGKNNIAGKYFDSAYDILSGKLRFVNNARKRYYKYMSLRYEHIKDYNNAYRYMRLYNDLSDSIEKQTKEKNTLFESLIYELKKKDEEIRSKNEAIRQSAEAEVKSRNIRSYSIFVFLLLSGMIYYMFSINRKLKKREQELEIKNAKIQSQNSTIQQALKEKDMLIKEVHHRVKNNLQLIISIINLQKQKGVCKESEGILDDLKFRIFSIANAHQMLYQKNSIQSVNIKEYIDSIFSNVKSSSEYPVSLSTEYENVEDINLGLDNAIIIGLMINEMFTNSVKHARNGKPIEITFKLKKDPWRNIFDFWFKDNGPGLPEDFHQIIRKSNSTGLELIYMLSQNLSANLEVYNDNGLCYHVRFEILSKEKQT